MGATLRPAVTMLALFTVLTGVLYPLSVTGAAQVLFSHQANGSLLREGNAVVGSELIGQPFSDPALFWGRASATAPFGYNAASSSGSNLGPSNPALREAVSARIAALRRAGAPGGPVPADLVTTSGSGLDPHLTPAAAYFQVSRVAKARHLSEDSVRRLVTAHVEARALQILGEPRVNVLVLNRALLKLAEGAQRAQAPP